MHRRRTTIQFVGTQFSRSVATATKLKPRDFSLPPGTPSSLPAPIVIPSKWALRTPDTNKKTQSTNNEWSRNPNSMSKNAYGAESLSLRRTPPKFLSSRSSKAMPYQSPRASDRLPPPHLQTPRGSHATSEVPPHLKPTNSNPTMAARGNALSSLNPQTHHQDALSSSQNGKLLQAPKVQKSEQGTFAGNSKDQKVEPVTYKVSPSELDSYDDRRGAARARKLIKERGSVVEKFKSELNEFHQSQRKKTQIKTVSINSRKRVRNLDRRASPDLYLPSIVTVGTLARLLNIRLEVLQRKMRVSGMIDEASYDHVLTSDYAALLAEEYGRNPVFDDEIAFDLYPPPPVNSTSLPSRPPVVTIMGHVDHGKTTLLDTLRSSSVAKSEAGGITQHIGAFSVSVNTGISATIDSPRSITFLDTPGHAAFSAMRARGAGVTDIIVLVVAADDGIMPQTKEVIELIKQDADVGLVVAINKVDKPGVDTEKVKRSLLAEGIQLEEYGGDVPCVHVSGLTGQGLPELVETLSLMADMQDLRAERDGSFHGHVLESKIHKGLGAVATVLVLRGSLDSGSHIISGLSHGKVRVMTDPLGNIVKVAYPGMAITVSGWKALPKAGDDVLKGNESEIKKALANRMRKQEIEASLIDVDIINATRRRERLLRDQQDADTQVETKLENGPQELRLLIKADVSGSMEAIQGTLQGIGNDKAMTRVVFSGVGDISESDVSMAKATNAIIVGFSVTAPRAIKTLAAQNNVVICTSNVIYTLMDDIKNRVVALLPPIVEVSVTGEATVNQLFTIHVKSKQTRTIAGCRVTNGVLDKSKSLRVVRHGETVFEGVFDNLRQLKKDVNEVRKGSECGLSLVGFDGLQEGDLIQNLQRVEKPNAL